MSTQRIIYWLMMALLTALILYLGFWLPFSQRPDSRAAEKLLLKFTKIAPDSVTGLRAYESGIGPINGFWLCLLRFDYSSDETVSRLIHELSLTSMPIQSLTSEALPWWYSESTTLEYFEDTDTEHSPVISVWIDREARRCFVRLAAS